MTREPADANVHEVAARGFGRGAADYERGRPGYPPDVVELLRRELGLHAGRTVLDVGAGTGKLTRLLPQTGARVLALEPVEGMRAQLLAAVPDVELVGGSAEAAELPDASVDAITVATAFHWFDGDRALREFHRLLGPGGALAVLWNARDESVEWVRGLNDVLGRAVSEGCNAPARAKAQALEESDWREPFDRTGLFTQAAEASIRHVQETDTDTQVARFRSVSFVAAMPDEALARFSTTMGDYLREHATAGGGDLIRFPYVCEVYVFRAA